MRIAVSWFFRLINSPEDNMIILSVGRPSSAFFFIKNASSCPEIRVRSMPTPGM